MDTLSETFEARLLETDEYLDFLETLESLSRSGGPKLGDTPISARQRKILRSLLYLQMYNLVEATATWCLGAIVKAATDGGKWKPADLSDDLRGEWIRATAKTHDANLPPEERWKAAADLCKLLIEDRPLEMWNIKGGGGNWDDERLNKMVKRLGVNLKLDDEPIVAVNQKIRDEMGAMKLIRKLRNDLAHGTISFAECGENATVEDLKVLRNRTVAYLREVIALFQSHIDSHQFIVESKRPTAGELP